MQRVCAAYHGRVLTGWRTAGSGDIRAAVSADRSAGGIGHLRRGGYVVRVFLGRVRSKRLTRKSAFRSAV